MTLPSPFFGLIKTILLLCICMPLFSAQAQDLDDIKKAGELRHLGVPYARFVMGNEEGLDVAITQLFAKHLGVRYVYVPTEWKTVITDLTGKTSPETPLNSKLIRGDIIASGLTILPKRKELLDFSIPTFPSAVWLIAKADFPVSPIKPSGNIDQDISATKNKLKLGVTYVMDSTCLDPKIHGLLQHNYRLRQFPEGLKLNDVVPSLLKGEADMSLLDVPDIIVALEKWPGQFKILGPISTEQKMGAAFRKESPKLRQAFNEFFADIITDGTYMKLVNTYYRSAPRYLPLFFKDITSSPFSTNPEN